MSHAANVIAALVVVSAACSLPATAAGAGAASSAPATHTVVIENLRFVPEVLEIRRGETVVWVNRDLVPHTATAAGSFDSGNLAPQASWKHVFPTAGTLSYVCRYHPTMKAQVIVK